MRSHFARFVRLVAPIFFLIAAFALPIACLGQSSSSDLILINGKIITVDAQDSIAQALSIHNGKIVAVGRSSAARRAAAEVLGADVVLDSREIDPAQYVREKNLSISTGPRASGCCL